MLSIRRFSSNVVRLVKNRDVDKSMLAFLNEEKSMKTNRPKATRIQNFDKSDQREYWNNVCNSLKGYHRSRDYEGFFLELNEVPKNKGIPPMYIYNEILSCLVSMRTSSCVELALSLLREMKLNQYDIRPMQMKMIGSIIGNSDKFYDIQRLESTLEDIFDDVSPFELELQATKSRFLLSNRQYEQAVDHFKTAFPRLINEFGCTTKQVMEEFPLFFFLEVASQKKDFQLMANMLKLALDNHLVISAQRWQAYLFSALEYSDHGLVSFIYHKAIKMNLIPGLTHETLERIAILFGQQADYDGVINIIEDIFSAQGETISSDSALSIIESFSESDLEWKSLWNLIEQFSKYGVNFSYKELEFLYPDLTSDISSQEDIAKLGRRVDTIDSNEQSTLLTLLMNLSISAICETRNFSALLTLMRVYKAYGYWKFLNQDSFNILIRSIGKNSGPTKIIGYEVFDMIKSKKEFCSLDESIVVNEDNYYYLISSQLCGDYSLIYYYLYHLIDDYNRVNPAIYGLLMGLQKSTKDKRLYSLMKELAGMDLVRAKKQQIETLFQKYQVYFADFPDDENISRLDKNSKNKVVKPYLFQYDKRDAVVLRVLKNSA